MQEDDLDIEDHTPPKRVTPLRGRRSTPHQSPRAFASPGSPSSGVYSGNEDGPPPQAPPRTKKTGGWASDLLNMGFHRKTKTQTLSPPKESRQKEPDFDDREDSENDIPVIPDLEELKDEELAGQVAQAPAAPINRVATLQELDNDLLKHSAFSTLDGLDLRILTRFLAPENETKEEDVPWTWDVLFTEVSSALNEEWEGKMDREIELPEL